MKKAWLIAFVALALPAVSHAADKNAAATLEENGESRFERQLESLSADLKLSKAQQAEARAIFDAARAKNADLRREIAQRRSQIRSEAEGKLLGLLKPDQRAKFEKVKAERAENRRFLTE